MRSGSLLVVAVLMVILAASMFSPAAASGYIAIHKVTTNGDTTTWFYFDTDGPGLGGTFILVGDASNSFSGPASGWFPQGEYTFTEDVPAGWVLTVSCVDAVVPSVADFDYIPRGVTITLSGCDTEGCFVVIDCTFTNSPAPAVGGVMIPANTLALVAPWLAVIGLVACIGTVVVVAEKRDKQNSQS